MPKITSDDDIITDEEMYDRLPLLGNRGLPFHTIGSRLLFTGWFMGLYIVQLILQMSLVSWGLIHHYYNSSVVHIIHEPLGFIILDIIATFLFLVEIAIRMAVLGKQYLRSLGNVTDIFVLIASIVSLCIYVWQPELLWYDMVCLILRYVFQTYRVVTIIRHLYLRNAMVDAGSDSICFAGPIDDQFNDWFYVDDGIP